MLNKTIEEFKQNICRKGLNKELDKQIAEAIIDDDEAIEKINEEIEGQAERIGEFPPVQIEPTEEVE